MTEPKRRTMKLVSFCMLRKDEGACPGYELAESWMDDLAEFMEEEVKSFDLTTEDLAHMWRHIVEAAARQMIRLNPEIVRTTVPE